MILNPQQLSGQAWVTNFDPKTRSNVERIDLILMLSECGPKNCLMLGSCWLSLAKEMSSFLLVCPKPGTWTSLFQYEFTYVGSCSIFQVLGCSTIRLSSYGTLHCLILTQHKGWDYQNNMGREPKFFVIFSLLHVINRCTMIHHLQYNHLPFKKNIFKCFHQFYRKNAWTFTTLYYFH